MTSAPVFTGTIVSGDGLGRKMGFPTVNVEMQNIETLSQGVFAVQGKIDTKEPFTGILHLGPRPTLGKMEIRTEIHLFEEHLVTPGMTIEFQTIGERIREVIQFPSLPDLQIQIAKDIALARKILQKDLPEEEFPL